jgi:hypothetical protein
MTSSFIAVLLLAVAAPARALLLDGALSRPAAVRARAPTVTAQLAPAPLKVKQRTVTTGPGGGKGGGGGAPTAAIAKPKRKAHTEDVPLYKVLLLGDEEYEEDPVRAAASRAACSEPG